MSIEPGTVVVPPTDGGEPSEVESDAHAALPILAGRYRLTRRIGKGGMGEVLAARDEQVGRDVAIKRMRAAAPHERAIQRFLREASIQGRLQHPAIVPVHEIGRDSDGLPFFVMKKLTGITLGKVVSDDEQRAAFSLQRILRAFADVCLAVAFAHRYGIVHRDLKPDNILLGDFGEVYILDWGVAKIVGEDGEPDVGEFADVGSGSGEHATAVGTTIGTAGYMAPEQALGQSDIDGRTDIYALGCVLFEILAGQPLHPRGPAGIRSALAGCDARPSQRPTGREIPPELDALCLAATARDRDARIQTARELGDRVQRFLDGDRDLALRRQIASDHFARARAAFDDGNTDELRRTAMREAAAALALDPELDGAAALVGRLMLEPPRTTPREVDEAIAADEVQTAKANARFGLWALLACLAFTPMLWWIAPRSSGWVIAYTGVLVLNTGIYLFSFHGKTLKPDLVIASNVITIALLARMFSPILIAPGVAAILALAMVITPRLSALGSAYAVGSLYIAAAITPLLLERLDVLDRTVSIGDAGILLRAPGVGGDENPAMLVAGIYAVGLIIGTCWMARAMRERARQAHHRLHLQAWQLRQLVPR
jgi:serine/threonine-protein kinase